MRRAIGAILFLSAVALIIWGAVFHRRALLVPGALRTDAPLRVTETTLNELMSREALTQTPEGQLTLTPKVAQRLAGLDRKGPGGVKDAAGESGGACST